MTPDELLRYGSFELTYGLDAYRFAPSMPQHPSRSAVRVFGKSLHMLAAGWMLSVLWIWAAGLRQNVLRQGVVPDDWGLPLLLTGVLSAAAVEIFAVMMGRWTGRAPHAWLQREEWHHAFWWSALPNFLLLGTAYLMIVWAF